MADVSTRTSLRRNRRGRIAFVQLEHAIAAAEHGSFRQAAEALLIKQSTLSRSIKLLEHSVGAAIFDRSRRGITTTPVGRHVLRTARSIVDQLGTLAMIAGANGRGDAGRLVVGFCTSLTTGNLRATLVDFKSKFPQVELGTIERSRIGLLAALRNGVVDMYVAAGETFAFDCKAAPIWSERIVAVLPSDHPLAAQAAVYWTDLRSQTVLLSRYDPGEELEALLNAKLLVPSDRPRVEWHDVSRGAIKSLISMGLGVSLVLESDIGATFAGLVYREIRDGTGPSRIGFSAVWRGDNENPALANFLRLVSVRYPLFPKA